MWIKDKKGLSTTELLFSVAFMGVMVFYCYQMLLRQKRVVTRVNQDVEATTFVFNMRNILAGSGCRENFRGYNRILPPGTIKSLKSLQLFEDGTSEIEEVYSVSELKGETTSQSGLEIQSYELDPKGLNSSMRTDKTYLLVTFLRPSLKETFKKQIRIYTQDVNGSITNCSLVPFNRNQGHFAQSGGELRFKGEKMVLGNGKERQGTLNLEGGIYATKPLGGCNKESEGSLYYDDDAKSWKLCALNGVVNLLDKRELPR